MFCNYCGGQLQPQQQFCGSCGKPSRPLAPPQGRVARNLRLLAILWIAFSALHLLRGGGHLLGARVLRGFGPAWFGDASWGWTTGDLVPSILSFVGLLSLLLAGAGFIVGFGLFERTPWARTLAVILAIIALFNPLLGTLLGIYTLWVLMPSDSEAEFNRMTRRA
jgi:hypothetical protein